MCASISVLVPQNVVDQGDTSGRTSWSHEGKIGPVLNELPRKVCSD